MSSNPISSDARAAAISCSQEDCASVSYPCLIEYPSKDLPKDASLSLLIHSKRALPLLLVIGSHTSARNLISRTFKQGGKAFHLALITPAQWDEDLSPWPADPVLSADDHFSGQGDAFLAWIIEKALPWIESSLLHPPLWKGIAGYSMGGLFALYAALKTDCFQKAACVSGSLWYPGFSSWAASQTLPDALRAVYFSLGNTEVKTANPALRTTGRIMETLSQRYHAEGLESTFVWNSGSHFQDPDGRMAKAIVWLTRCDQSSVPCSSDQQPPHFS